MGLFFLPYKVCKTYKSPYKNQKQKSLFSQKLKTIILVSLKQYVETEKSLWVSMKSIPLRGIQITFYNGLWKQKSTHKKDKKLLDGVLTSKLKPEEQDIILLQNKKDISSTKIMLVKTCFIQQLTRSSIIPTDYKFCMFWLNVLKDISVMRLGIICASFRLITPKRRQMFSKRIQILNRLVSMVKTISSIPELSHQLEIKTLLKINNLQIEVKQ